MKDKIRQWLKDNDLWYSIHPRDHRICEWYADKLVDKLPELYQYLIDEGEVQSGKYMEFIHMINNSFNRARYGRAF